MKTLKLLTVALLLALTANAQQRTKNAIIGDAKQALNKSFGATNSLKLNQLQIVDNIGQIAIVSSDGCGTAFVSNNTNNARVLGISPSTYVKGNTLPCGLQLWLEAANHALQKNKTIKKALGDKGADIPAFITTKWSQEKPFYNLCPQSGLKRCVTGCVATAMAQIMNYYEYPAQGKGDATYYVKKKSGTTDTKTATISGVYDWDNMADNYSVSYTTAQATAVATLMRDCGYSVGMTYAADGSGAVDIYVPGAFATNFEYDSLTINYLQHDYCDEEVWYNTIYNELSEKRPIIFAGVSSDGGGHEFVLDGMNTDGLVHINWGWAGDYDGFFDLDVMEASRDYIQDQSMVYGFNPEPTQQTGEKSYNTNIAVMSPKLTTSDGQLYFGGGVVNIDWREFLGDLIFCVQSITDPDTYSYGLAFMRAPEDGEDATALPGGSGWQFTSSSSNGLLDFNSYFVEDGSTKKVIFPAGEYEVFIAYQGVNDEYMKYAITEGGIAWRQKITVANDGTITIGGLISAISSPTTTTNTSTTNDDKTYNIAGQRVGNSFKGIVIKNGKKFVNK